MAYQIRWGVTEGDIGNGDYVIETNSYTLSEGGFTNTYWYRIYKSGWVEQGGLFSKSVTGENVFEVEIDFPIELESNAKGALWSNTSQPHPYYNQPMGVIANTTHMIVRHSEGSQGNRTIIISGSWEVKGFKAVE